MNQNKSKFLPCAVALLTYGAVQVYAQTTAAAPTAGDLQRQIAPEREPALPALQVKPARVVKPSPAAAGVKMVIVNQWELVGNTVLQTPDLLQALKPFTGVALSMVQINEAAALVQQTYEDAGYLARVQMPKQDVTDGTVRLQIIEARLDKILLDPGATSRVSMARVQRTITQQHPLGTVLNTQQLDRGLLLADDLPGVSLAGMLQAGQTQGSTDLLIKTTEEPPQAVEMSIDNTGARAVGPEKLNLSATFSSPWSWGETLALQFQRSEGSQYGRIGYGLPLGYSGLRANAFASNMDYRVVAAEFKENNLSGRAKSHGFDLSYPLLRTRQANVYANAQLEQRGYNAWVGTEVNPDGWYHINALQLGVSANAFDSVGGGGASSLNVQLLRGEVRGESPTFASNREGYFSKLRISATRQQTVSPSLTVFAALQAQYTPNATLDSAENMSLGGASGVRAYPSGEASGPMGQMLNLELRWRISPEWLLSPFIDWGKVEQRDITAGGPNAYELAGAGVGLNWTGPDGWSAKLVYASRVGSNPHPKVTDSKQVLDQDGSMVHDRYWLTISRTL